jgi:peroxiredoxin
VTNTEATELWLIATSALATLATTVSVLLWRENRRLRSTDNRAATTAPRQIGALAPHFTLPSAAGGVVSLQDLLADDRACVLTFVHPGCGPCASLLPELAHWQDPITERLTLTLITPAEATEAQKLAHEHILTNVLIDKQSTVMHAYGVMGTPSAVLIASDGTVRSTLAAGPIAIESLIRLALQDQTRPAPTQGNHNTPNQAATFAA